MFFPSNILAAVPAILLIYIPAVSALPAKHSRFGNEVSNSNLSTSTSMISPEPNTSALALDRRSPFSDPIQKAFAKKLLEQERRAKEAAAKRAVAQKKKYRDEYNQYMAKQKAKYDAEQKAKHDAAAALPHDPPRRRRIIGKPVDRKPQGRAQPAAQKPTPKRAGRFVSASQHHHKAPAYAINTGEMKYDAGPEEDSDE